MTLYELTQAYADVQAMLSDEDVPETDVFAALDAISGQIEQKADSCAMVIKNTDADARELEARAAILREEAKRLTDKAHALDARTARLKRYVLDAMTASGKPKIKTSLFSMYPKTTKSVSVTDLQAAFESGYLKPIRCVEDSLDKTAIKKALENGETVAGCELTDNTTLVIR